MRWRLAGVEQAAAKPVLPFFIEWARGTPLPGSAPVAHDVGEVAIHELQLTGDVDELSAWLGEPRIRMSVRPGEPAVTAVVVATAGSQFVLGDDLR